MSLSSQNYHDTVTELYSHCDPDPEKCACGGGGWLLSDYDTWHPCSFAGHEGPHPEEDPRCDGCEACQARLDDCQNDIFIGPQQWSEIPF